MLLDGQAPSLGVRDWRDWSTTEGSHTAGAPLQHLQPVAERATVSMAEIHDKTVEIYEEIVETYEETIETV